MQLQWLILSTAQVWQVFVGQPAETQPCVGGGQLLEQAVYVHGTGGGVGCGQIGDSFGGQEFALALDIFWISRSKSSNKFGILFLLMHSFFPFPYQK